MKKVISLLVAFVMCLSLCACGGGEQNNETQPNQTEVQTNELNLCQEWKAVSDGQTMRFDEEDKIYINGESYVYEYDDETSKISVNFYGFQINLSVTVVDGVHHIEVEGKDFVPASEYERLHAEYAKTMLVIPGFDGTPALNAALVGEHIDRVELTVNNWRDYIKVYQYDVEVVKRDAFGEVTNTEVSTVIRLGYGTEQYHYLDAIIELQHKETGEITIYGPHSHQGKSFILDSSIDLDAYECTRIKGYLYFFDFTEEVLDKVTDIHDHWSVHSANATINFTCSSFEGTWEVDTDAKVITNASEEWSDYFD